MSFRKATGQKPPPGCEICILAGGLSSRMGRNKAALRIGGRRLLTIVRSNAGELQLPIRVIRRDLVPRCGPLGGIYTALKTSRAGRVLFLACDMPFVPMLLLRRLLENSEKHAVFVSQGEKPGFPFILHREHLPAVESQMQAQRFSLGALPQALGARVIRARGLPKEALMNLNTPEDWEQARRLLNCESESRGKD